MNTVEQGNRIMEDVWLTNGSSDTGQGRLTYFFRSPVETPGSDPLVGVATRYHGNAEAEEEGTHTSHANVAQL